MQILAAAVHILVPLMVACSTGPADFDAQCGAGECRQEGGAVLLQVTSDSAGRKARLGEKAASAVTSKAAAKAEVATEHGDAAQSASSTQLSQYTKLKQKLAKSKESADIMKKIDAALDADIKGADGKKAEGAATPSANDARSLDDVLKVVDAKQQNRPEVSLLEAGSERARPQGIDTRRDLQDEEQSDENDVEQEDAVEEEGSDGDEPDDEDVQSKDDGQEGDDTEEDADDVDEDEAATDTADDQADLGAASRKQSAGIENDEEDSEDSEETSVVQKDDEVSAKPRRKKLALMAVMDMLEAERAPLNEDGYVDVANSRSNRRMERFVERLADEMSLMIVDEGGLKGLVPYYSGQKATQSFESLQAELLSTARMTDGWVSRKHKKRRKERMHTEANLLQTDASQHKAHHSAESSRPALSLLSAVRAVHKVPDLAVAVFGSRTIVLGCTMALIIALICVDEKKRSAKGMEYEDPLNMSPTPPPCKEDPIVTANLKLLRGGKDAFSGPMQKQLS